MKYKILNLATGEFLNDWSEDYTRTVHYEFRSLELARMQVSMYAYSTFPVRAEYLEIIEVEDVL